MVGPASDGYSFSYCADEAVSAFEKRESGACRVPLMSFAKMTWQSRPVRSERALATRLWVVGGQWSVVGEW